MQQLTRTVQPELLTGSLSVGAAGRRLLVSVEKRTNFTLRDRAARANAYDFFRTLFRPDTAETPQADGMAGGRPQLVGHCIPVDKIERRHQFERPRDVELWELHWAQC